MSKFKITIAIPTFNRVDRLNQLIESIESQYIPKEVDLKVAISNTASQDDTFTYLNLLSKFDSHKYIIHNKIKFVPNWYNLISIVPADSHYVWLIGDDDELTSKYSLSRLYKTLCKQPNLPAIFVPASSKERDNGLEIGRVEELCNLYGFHKILGWISSHVLRYDIYLEVYKIFGERYSFKHTNPRDCYKNQIGLFLHSTTVYKIIFGKNVAILYDDIIAEQAYQRDIKSIIRDGDYRLKKYYSFRFFFDISDLYDINTERKFKPTENFFRYVSKDFLILLLDILIEGYILKSISKKELIFFVSLLRSKLLNYFSSYQKNYSDIILYLLTELTEKSPRRSLNNTNFLRLLKVNKYEKN